MTYDVDPPCQVTGTTPMLPWRFFTTLISAAVRSAFSAAMKQSALNVTGALKDGLRNQIGQQMDVLLNDLFRIKSLQDQGKVEKPY